QAADDKFEDPPCNFLISPDSNTMTLVVPIDQKSPDESRKLLISVFSRNLSPVWSQTITLPFSEGSYIISEKVNNNNDVFLLLANKMSSDDRKTYKQNGNSEDEKNVYSLCSITGKGI